MIDKYQAELIHQKDSALKESILVTNVKYIKCSVTSFTRIRLELHKVEEPA